ncbi:M36 family metallopeptidase [Aequorivita flava]|uniref:M36 family metallopeptidase n=1 Tax=Aequorivita flava TaxID=3114371 RepID=A0AB35YXM2_9FLAO
MKKLTLLLLVLSAMPIQLCAQHKNPEKEKEVAQYATESSTISLNQLIKQKSNTYVITQEHVSRLSGIRHVYLRQAINGVEVFGTESSVHLDKTGKVLMEHNSFLNDVKATLKGSSQGISARQAITSVAGQMGYKISNLQELQNKGGKNKAAVFNKAGISLVDIPAKLMYYYREGAGTQLIWELSIAETTSTDWWNFRVDASTGKIIDKNNWTVSCNIMDKHNEHYHGENAVNYTTLIGPITEIEASYIYDETPKNLISEVPEALASGYRVYAMPVESPNHGARSMQVDPDDAVASPFGWHDTDGVAGPEFTVTTGNNVDAHKGIDRPDGTAALNFDFPIDLTQNPALNTAPYITNLFYWNNIMHDVLYQYGFDEASGNFQENNYLRGGLGSDSVNANAQAPGNCNANFGTPVDGSNPTMNMFLCSNSTPAHDGSLDAGVVTHEYGHGVSNRLTGGGGNVSCLNNAEQMGEGWSDFYGLLLTIEPGDTGTDARGVGTYLLGQPTTGPGVRTQRYSTDFAVNNHTYDDIKTMAIPHGVGEVWATMLWDMTWGIIATVPFDPDVYYGNGGNNVALAIVTEGLKLQPCSPGFVDGRDAILAADQALYGGAHVCAIWEAFARRGLGFSASQGSSSSTTDGTEAFDLPPGFSNLDVIDEVCMSAGIQTGLTGGSPTGGHYTGSGVTDDGNGTTFTFDPTVGGPGLVTVTYTVNDPCTGNPTTLTDDINVTNDPPVIICRGSGAIPMTGSSSDSPGLPIPDNNPTGVTATMNVTENVTITDLDVDINISHTWVGDIIVTLKSPAGTTATIIDRPGRTTSGAGCSRDDIDATLDDEAATPVETECATATPTIDGSFIPNNPLSIFDGENTAGIWEVTVSDNAGADTGTLNSWAIHYDYEELAPVLDVTLDATGNATVNAADFLHSVTVDCGGYTVLAGAPLGATVSFTCADIGMNTIPVEVTNDNGATSTCSALVNVIGVAVPSTLTCPADITQNNDPGTCGANITVPMAVFGAGCGSGSCIQVDDIESYTLGPILGQNANWETWTPGTPSESAEVSTDQAQSGTKSVKITGVPAGGPVDQTYRLGNLASGVWEVKYSMYIPVGNSAFTNIQKSETSGTEWAHQIQFNSDGTANYQVENTLNPFVYPQGGWFEVMFYIDLTNDTCEFFIDGTSIITHPYSSFSTGIGGLSTIGSINFFPRTNEFGTDPNPTATPLFYIDDLSLCVVPINDYNNTADASDTYPVGSTNVVWTAIDQAGASYSCTQVITVNDVEDPVISCPANVIVNNDLGSCGAIVNYTAPTATDNCGVANTCTTEDFETYVLPTGTSEVLPGVTTLDENTVANGQGPGLVQDGCVYQVPSGYFQWNAAGYFGQVNKNIVGNTTNTMNLIYDTPVHSVNFNLSAFNGFADTATIEAFDTGGVSLGVVGPVAIPDATPVPVSFAIPGIKTITIVGSRGWTPLLNDHVFCFSSVLVPVQTAGLPSGSNFPVGTTTNTFVVTDGAGNSATCSFDVTVNDTEAPTASCVAPFTLQLDVNGDASITAADIDAGSTDNCAIASVSIAPSNFTCADVGPNTVTLTVTDTSGNVSTCTTIVTVEDNVAPTAVCQPFTAQLDATGNVTITGADVDGGSADACGIASLSVSPNAFTCADVGPHTVTLTVTDVNGNVSTCTTTVTVEDNVAPVANCAAPFTLQLDASGNASITVGDIDAGSTDACGIATTTIDKMNFTCADVGPNTVTLTVTDVNGNVSTCTTTVTVEDSIAPTIICPADITANTDAGDCFATVTFVTPVAFDNCGIASVVQTMGDPSGSSFPVGVNTIEFTATDVNGNTSTCSFTITVTDNEPPTMVCQNITIQLDGAGNATITPADVDGGSSDNCGIATSSVSPSTFDCSDVGTNNVTLTVTDVHGNTSTCTAIVTVEDVTAPVAVCQDITVALDASGTVTIAGIDVDGGSTDACGIASYDLDIDTFDCSNVGDNIVTLTVTDVNGNTSTCTATVTVEDNTSPVLVCQDFTLELGADGTAVLDPSDVIASNDDACGIFASAVDITNFSCADIGAPITVQVFTMDVNGNLATCTAQVTVVDLLAPVITCPADQTVDPGPGNIFYILPDYFATGEATAIDNCTDPVTLTSQSPAAGTPLADGTYTITFTAEDAYGNVSTCDFELIVESVLGVGDNNANIGSVQMYPNPAKNTVMIGNPQSLSLENLNIFDIRGRVVKTIDLRNMGSEKAIDISELAAATYIVIIEGENGRITKRLIKE